MKIIRRYITKALLLLAIMMMIVQGCFVLLDKGKENLLKENACETATFRSMRIDRDVLNTLRGNSASRGKSIGELLAVAMPLSKYDLSVEKQLPTDDIFEQYQELYSTSNANAYKQLQEAYRAIWDDIVYFPVTDSIHSQKAQSGYEDSWMMERNYGGKRGHEGCDVFPLENVPGQYPIISMTSGVVENIGWLPQGGYRIGIRSPHNGYFYYAHLDSYGKDFKVGDTVLAGEFLGFMGDSGYSETPGTKGLFDVHLHLGIYIATANYEELSINPYAVLRYLEGQKLKYDYEV